MKTIGLIGGMSRESSADYYALINQAVQKKLGGLHSASILMYSYDFADIALLQEREQRETMAAELVDKAQKLQNAGAEAIAICTNTMHLVAPQVQAMITVPLLHIGEVTAKVIKAQNMQTIGLLGTKYTMQKDFYTAKLAASGIATITPSLEEQEIIHSIIYDELCTGNVLDTSRKKVTDIIERLHTKGAQGIVLGCTELPKLVQQSHTNVPLFSTTDLHVDACVECMLGG